MNKNSIKDKVTINGSEKMFNIDADEVDILHPSVISFSEEEGLQNSSLTSNRQPQTPTRAMNSIIEEEDSPDVTCSTVEDASDLYASVPGSQQGKRLSFYSNKESNNSSTSLIMNKGFIFGGDSVFSSANQTTVDENFVPYQVGQGYSGSASKRNSQSLKYVPIPKLPPVNRTRSPNRNTRSPSPERIATRGNKPSGKSDGGPFNFSSSSLQPPQSGSRTLFRKGHRYKHSSVSMNFFQEPEVKVPLNIAKSLPVPDFSDLKLNFTWPTHHIQLGLVVLQALSCLTVFHFGQSNTWTNFFTLSHFILYDILGSLAVVFIDLLSYFEVWGTSTIRYPFGLKRIDVLISFGFAISMCFVGLDLVFHVVEEIVVLFVESSNHEQHVDLVENIPHSHNSSITDSDMLLWYSVLCASAVISTATLWFTFYSKNNIDNKYKTKTPFITLLYTSYLMMYPIIAGFTRFTDFVATISIALFIIYYGLKVVKWTGTMLLMGFPVTSLESQGGMFLADKDFVKPAKAEDSGAVIEEDYVPEMHMRSKMFFDQEYEPTIVKAKLGEKIEQLNAFKSNCTFKYTDLIISNVNFNFYIVLMRLNMKGGSNEEELALRLEIDKCVRTFFQNVETTLEIERL
ncbi:HHL217Cp [Eremothecium sinecaudum]|uniref:HHL217Cp n=1 Tax=Eremothecium sinecaudum TaxID=45286 RepID=A0A0X8HW75_9SACH|nr:HHL217Cp [Eremothecium sinecaudum]AMD22553.1 HHL217Cp [Eremothecium sinecaudum]